jgi:Protein of unknown function (DUF3631)
MTDDVLTFADRIGHPGAAVLDDLERFVRRFVVFTSAHQARAVALWVMHCWTFAAADTTPRLAVQSPERESGKTRLLEVLELLVREPMQALDATPAALFRSIAAGPVTFLVDEVDTVFSSKNGDDKSADVRAILNAGYRRGAVVPRADPKTKQVERCPVFAPVALAGIGALPDTVQSRALVIALRRRKSSEPIDRFRRRRVSPEAEQLRKQCTEWAEECLDELREADPQLPDELGDRAQDFWEPLLAVADAAGGQWPERARDAAKALSAHIDQDRESLTVRLLADCRYVIGTQDKIASKTLAADLAALDDAPWAEWYGKPISPTGVARLLSGHVRPRVLRDGDDVYKGYRRTDFEDSWQRYLPLSPLPPRMNRYTVTTPRNTGLQGCRKITA